MKKVYRGHFVSKNSAAINDHSLLSLLRQTSSRLLELSWTSSHAPSALTLFRFQSIFLERNIDILRKHEKVANIAFSLFWMVLIYNQRRNVCKVAKISSNSFRARWCSQYNLEPTRILQTCGYNNIMKNVFLETWMFCNGYDSFK